MYDKPTSYRHSTSNWLPCFGSGIMANKSTTLAVLPGTRYRPRTLTTFIALKFSTLFLIRQGADPFPLFPFRTPQSSLAAWRRCGSQFPGVVDQIQRSIGNGLGYTKRKPCCCVSSCSFTILVLSKPLHLYLLFSLYNSPSYTSLLSFKSSFLHLFFI